MKKFNNGFLSKKDLFKSFVERLENRQLLSVQAVSEESNSLDLLEGDIPLEFADESIFIQEKCIPVGEHMSCSSFDLIERATNDLGVTASAVDQNSDINFSTQALKLAHYSLRVFLQSIATSFEDNAFVRAEAVKDGEFQWNVGWTQSALISMGSEFLADKLESDQNRDDTTDATSTLEHVIDFLTTLPFGTIGLYVIQHASSTTSIKFKNKLNSRLEEITRKPFTAWFVGGSLLGSAIAVLPELYFHGLRGDIIDVSPLSKALKHNWDLQHSHDHHTHIFIDNTGINVYRLGTSPIDFKSIYHQPEGTLGIVDVANVFWDLAPRVDLYKLTTLSGELVFIGLMSMMENRAHEEGGVLVKQSGLKFFEFAYNTQYHRNYAGLRVFTALAEVCRSHYTDEPLEQPSVGGFVLREIGTYGYMTALYYGSITSFYVPDAAKSALIYAMDVPRAMVMHSLGVLFRDGMHSLADWYERV